MNSAEILSKKTKDLSDNAEVHFAKRCGEILSPLASGWPFALLLHVPMVFLQAADFEAAEVVLVHEAFHGRGEGGDGRGDRNAGHHSLRAHLDLYALRTVSLLVK